MNISELLVPLLSNNQRKLVEALLEHPEGLMSNELAALTEVSNKSATMTPDVREILQEHGLELVIERDKQSSRWVLRKIDKDVLISEAKLDEVRLYCSEANRLCKRVNDDAKEIGLLVENIRNLIK